MARSYSSDLRSRVLDVIDSGLSTHKAARRFNIGVATAVRWHRVWRDHGECKARKQGPKGGGKLDGHEAFILGLLEKTARHHPGGDWRVAGCGALGISRTINDLAVL